MGKECSAFHPGPEHCSNEGRIHLRRPTCHSHFSLATKRRTIHSGWPTIHERGSVPSPGLYGYGPDVGLRDRSEKYPAATSFVSRGSRSVPRYSSRKSSSTCTFGVSREGLENSAQRVIGSGTHCGRICTRAFRTSGLFAIHNGRMTIPNPPRASFRATVGSLVTTRKRISGVTTFLPLLNFQGPEPTQLCSGRSSGVDRSPASFR